MSIFLSLLVFALTASLCHGGMPIYEFIQPSPAPGVSVDFHHPNVFVVNASTPASFTRNVDPDVDAAGVYDGHPVLVLRQMNAFDIMVLRSLPKAWLSADSDINFRAVKMASLSMLSQVSPSFVRALTGPKLFPKARWIEAPCYNDLQYDMPLWIPDKRFDATSPEVAYNYRLYIFFDCPFIKEVPVKFIERMLSVVSNLSNSIDDEFRKQNDIHFDVWVRLENTNIAALSGAFFWQPILDTRLCAAFGVCDIELVWSNDVPTFDCRRNEFIFANLPKAVLDEITDTEGLESATLEDKNRMIRHYVLQSFGIAFDHTTFRCVSRRRLASQDRRIELNLRDWFRQAVIIKPYIVLEDEQRSPTRAPVTTIGPDDVARHRKRALARMAETPLPSGRHKRAKSTPPNTS